MCAEKYLGVYPRGLSIIQGFIYTRDTGDLSTLMTRGNFGAVRLAAARPSGGERFVWNDLAFNRTTKPVALVALYSKPPFTTYHAKRQTPLRSTECRGSKCVVVGECAGGCGGRKRVTLDETPLFRRGLLQSNTLRVTSYQSYQHRAVAARCLETQNLVPRRLIVVFGYSCRHYLPTLRLVWTLQHLHFDIGIAAELILTLKPLAVEQPSRLHDVGQMAH